jgi:antitoxin component YwqK of YwqJK toxin-antitoxin module
LITSISGLQYAPGSDKPYSGEAVWYHENGQKSEVTSYKNGKQDGLYTGWYENGQKFLKELTRMGNMMDYILRGMEWTEKGRRDL